MFGIGAFELVVILVVALIAIGPDRMPGFMKTVGKGIKEVRRTTRELRSSVGLDEVLRDETIRDPLGLKKPVAATSSHRRALAFEDEDRARERPEQGVDVDFLKSREKEPTA
jgi:sec-independent protein translocase protein TatB